jgi:hypothetical protein
MTESHRAHAMNINLKASHLLILIAVMAATGCSRTERIIKVAELPNTPEFDIEARPQFAPATSVKAEKAHLDIGYLWNQNKILFFPIFNDNGRFVGYIGSDVQYIELKKGELEDLTTRANIPLPQTPSIPFWDAWGGKLLLAVLIPPFVVLSLFLERLWRKISTGM